MVLFIIVMSPTQPTTIGTTNHDSNTSNNSSNSNICTQNNVYWSNEKKRKTDKLALDLATWT